MASKRMLQIAEDIRAHIALLLVSGKVADPRLQGVTIQRVQLAPDLQHAKIYYSVWDKSRKADAAKGLSGAAGFLRKSISESLRLRYTPQLIFFFDEELEKSMHITEILQTVHRELEESAKKSEDEKSQDKEENS